MGEILKLLIEVFDKLLEKIGLVRRGEVVSEEETRLEITNMLKEMGMQDVNLTSKPDPTLSIREGNTLEILPGSAEAQVEGCTCDPSSNTNGIGLYAGIKNWRGQRMYALLEGCPVHGKESNIS